MTRTKVKIKFTIHIKKVTNISLPEGTLVFVHWRRGSSSAGRTGDTEVKSVPASKEISWDYEFNFTSKLEYEKEVEKFHDSKKLTLTLKEGRKSGLFKTHKTFGKTYLRLSEYAQRDGSAEIPIKFTMKDKRSDTSIFVSIKADWIKVGRNAWPPSGESSGGYLTAGSGQDDGFTDTTVDSQSDTSSEDEMTNPFDEKESETSEPAKVDNSKAFSNLTDGARSLPLDFNPKRSQSSAQFIYPPLSPTEELEFRDFRVKLYAFFTTVLLVLAFF